MGMEEQLKIWQKRWDRAGSNPMNERVFTEMKSVIEEQQKEIEKLKDTTILQMAQQLEDGLLHACTLDGEMSVLEFIKHYLR